MKEEEGAGKSRNIHVLGSEVQRRHFCGNCKRQGPSLLKNFGGTILYCLRFDDATPCLLNRSTTVL